MPSLDPRIYLCNLGMVCLAISQNTAPLLFTTFSGEFGGENGLSPAMLGRIPIVVYTVMMLSVMVAGPLADRYGAKPVTLAGLAAVILSLLIMAAAQNFNTILLAAVFFGFGAICLDVVLSPIVAAITPHNRSGALNRLHTWFCVGSVLIAAFVAAGLWLGVPWRILLLGLAVVPTINLIGFLRIPSLPLIHEDHVTITLPQLFRFPTFPLLLLIMMLAGAAEASMAQWLPTFAELELGYTKAMGGFALACFSIAMAIGRYGVGRYIQSHGSVRTLQGMALGAVLLYLAAGLLAVPVLALVAAVVLGLFVGCMFPTGMAISGDALPSGGATFYGLLAAAGCLGGILSQWLIGEIGTRYTLTHAVAFSSLYPLGLILCLFTYAHFIRPRKG